MDKPYDPSFDMQTVRKPRAKKDNSYRTSAGVVLCRSPIITRELSEFEQAFYAYQRHLKSRLSSPFPTDFYFTKGSLAAKRWLAGEEERLRANDLVATNAQIAEDTTDITAETSQNRAGVQFVIVPVGSYGLGVWTSSSRTQG